MPQDEELIRENRPDPRFKQTAFSNVQAERIEIGQFIQMVVYLGLPSDSRHRRFVQWLTIGFYLTCLIGVFIRLWKNGADFTTLLLLVIFAIPLLICAGFFVWQFVWQSIPPHSIIVLVANFDGLDEKHYRVGTKFRTALKKAVKPYSDVKVQALDKVITEEQGSDIARAEGKKRKATIVIWGWYGVPKDFNIMVNFELLRPPAYFPQTIEDTQTLTDGQNLAVSELNTVTLPTSLNGMSYLTLFTMGMARYAYKDWDGAIDRFSEALAQVETNVLALGQYAVYFYRGLSYTFKSNHKGAVLDYKTLDKTLGLRPDIVEAYTDIVEAHNNREETRAAQSNYTKAIEDYTQALNLKSDLPEAYNNRAGTYIAQGNYIKAIEDCNQALKLNSNNADAYNNRGIAYSRQGNYIESIEDYDRAIELKATANTYLVRGIAHAREGNYTKAIEDYSQAIELKKDYADAYGNRGIAYDDQSNYSKAIEDYSQVLHLKQDDDRLYRFHRFRGFAYNEQGNYPKAIEDYSQALNLKSSAEIYNSRGTVHAAQGNYLEAIKDYNQAIELKKDYAVAYYNRGNAYGDQGNYLEAIEDYNQAIELKPDAEAYNNRGSAHAYQHSYTQAIEDYSQAITLKPDCANAYLGKGIAYHLSGDNSNAIQAFKRVLELTHDPAIGQAAEQSLQELGAK